MQLGTSKGGVAGAVGPCSKVVANKLVLAAITIFLAAIVLSAAFFAPWHLKIKQGLVNVPFWSILGIWTSLSSISWRDYPQVFG